MRLAVAEGPGSPALSSEDGQLARRQIERLQRMLRHLRQLTLPPPELEPVPGLDLLRRAAAEVADLFATKRLTLTWAVPTPLMLRSDAPLLYILAQNLLAAVARDAETESTVVVQATLPSGREGGTLEVWEAQAVKRSRLQEIRSILGLQCSQRTPTWGSPSASRAWT